MSASVHNRPMQLRIRRLVPHASLPSYATSGAAAFDLAAVDDVTIPPRELRLIPTGLVIEVPAGYFLAVFARSSTPLRRGLILANGVGVIDPDYCGPDDEVKLLVMNVKDESAVVKRGDRLAQGIVLPSPRIEWIEIQTSDATSRGGFGATGG
jgi:dUTP pyrophosphatase